MSLKEDIEKKFRTVTRFAKIAELDAAKLSNYLGRGKYKRSTHKHIRACLNMYEDKPLEGEIEDYLRYSIRANIIAKYSTQKNFCDKYGFTEAYISNLTSGKQFFRITNKVKRVCKILEIEI
jgi:hypothetical protein